MTVKDNAVPNAYGAFASVFGRLSDPLQMALFGQLEQLEPLIADLDVPELAPQGEFEGLGGLTRRGDIAQVVQSELLLRTEAPLEFLRRLAESETLYYERVYADPGVRAVYRVIVSAGPGLLGHARILALAGLFLMARIAAARGAAFHWCFRPAQDGAWFEGLTVNSVKRLLRSVSYREMRSDDLAVALDEWSALNPFKPQQAPQMIDWVIGEGGAQRRPQQALAVDTATSVLAFRMLPAAGPQRACELTVRRRAAAVTRSEIAFLSDGVCLSALRDPFRPLAPARAAPGGPSRRAKAGWAPDHFCVAGTDGVLVRWSDALLVLRLGERNTVAQRFVLPIDSHTKLAGARLMGSDLTLLLQRRRDGLDGLEFGGYRLVDDRPAQYSNLRLAFPAEHLFLKAGKHQIPPLSAELGVDQFFSNSGMSFELHVSGGAHQVRPKYNGSKILSSTGLHTVVQSEAQGRSTLLVRGLGGKVADTFECPSSFHPDRLKDMLYTRSERGLAYTEDSRTWTALPPLYGARSDEGHGFVPIPIASEETLISGRLRGSVVQARIWSDARFGGDGSVRGAELVKDKMVGRGQRFSLGERAMDIVKVQMRDDGVFVALAVDAAGEPDELLLYRPKHQRGPIATIDLKHEREAATALLLGQDRA